jgi:hypothetical protein
MVSSKDVLAQNEKEIIRRNQNHKFRKIWYENRDGENT